MDLWASDASTMGGFAVGAGWRLRYVCLSVDAASSWRQPTDWADGTTKSSASIESLHVNNSPIATSPRRKARFQFQHNTHIVREPRSKNAYRIMGAIGSKSSANWPRKSQCNYLTRCACVCRTVAHHPRYTAYYIKHSTSKLQFKAKGTDCFQAT